jgi:hypothetical protein
MGQLFSELVLSYTYVKKIEEKETWTNRRVRMRLTTLHSRKNNSTLPTSRNCSFTSSTSGKYEVVVRV